MASRKLKAAQYRKTTQEWDRKFELLGLERPQEENSLLLQRARQVNFGLLNCSENRNRDMILSFKPADSVIKCKRKFKCFPTGVSQPTWVDTKEKFDKFMDRLRTCDEFTIDLEVHGHRTLTDFVCLIQVGTWDYGDYLIDPFKTREEIFNALKSVLESPKHLKIGHDITNDVKWLQKDFDIFMVGAVDTQIMYKVLHGDCQMSFDKLVASYNPEQLKNMPKETMSDWRLRPGRGMTPEQEIYAVNDVHILLRVFDEMRSEIKEEQFYLTCEESKRKLLEVAKQLKGGETVKKDYDKDASEELKRMSGRKGITFVKKLQTVQQKGVPVFTVLLEWRDLLSKILDEKPDLLVSSWTLLELAITDDSSIPKIKEILGPVNKRISDRSSSECLQAGVVQKLIQSHGKYIDEIRNHECHNCLKIGHGPAWACPFPKIKGNYKAFFLRPENEQYRHKQYDRKWKKLVEKFGEEKANDIVNKTKQSS